MIAISPYLFLTKTWPCLPLTSSIPLAMYAVTGSVVANVCEVIDVLINIPTNTKDRVGKADHTLLDLADAGGLKALIVPAHLPSLQNALRADESPSAQVFADPHHHLDAISGLDPLHRTIDKARGQ